MRFCDLGPLQIEMDGEQVAPRGRRLASILGTLLLHLGRRVSVDLLLDAVWGDEATAASTSTLETHIWRLRRTLEPHRARGEAASVLLNDSGGYRLVATASDVDSSRFEQLNLDVLDLLTTDQPDRALQAADQALALWRGEPFADLVDRAWAVGPITRLAEIKTQLQERRVDAILAVGHSERAVAELVPLLAQHPFRERLWWQRMLALYRSGRTDDALSTYQAARTSLLDEVGLEPGPELVALQRRILDQEPTLLLPRPTSARSLRPARQPELRLPRPRPMLGRGRDLHAVGELLQIASLVTIVGAAGCGKTLLATEAARLAVDRYPDGVRFVDLSAAEPDSDVAEQVASDLDLAVPPGAAALTTLIGYATDRRALLVLDNCEQVLDQVAELADALTGPDDRQVDLLVTSREPVGLPNEEVYALAPLAVRTDPDAPTALSAADEPAVALFLARARLSTDLAPDDVSVIRQICRAVDGIPLAIELAASLASTFSFSEIADQVERDPGQLAAIGRGQARHHQTLTSAIDRSYRLLSTDEQTMHRRLSVLPGAFGRELADAVAGPELRGRAAPLLANLVHRSLLAVSHVDGSARFTQLAPVRAHANHALRAAAEVDVAERLRDAWVQALVTGRPPAGRPEEADWYQAVDLELPTVRATLHRHLVVSPDPLGSEIVGQLLGFWYYLDLVEEGIRWSEAALPVAGPGLPAVIARLALADLLALQGRSDRSRALTLEATDLITSDGDRLRVAGDAGPLPDGDERFLLEVLLSMASAASVPRDAEAMQHLLELAASSSLLHRDPDLSLLHEVFSCLAESMARPEREALVRVEQLFRRAEGQGNVWATWATATIGAMIGLVHRDPALGLLWSRRVVDNQSRLGAKTVVSQVETYGDFLALAGRYAPAVRIFAATHQQSRRTGRSWPRNTLTTEMLDSCRARLDTAEFDAAWAIGPTLDRAELTR